MTPTQRNLLIFGPIALAAGIVAYVSIRNRKKNTIIPTPDTAGDAVKAAVIPASSSFPLKKGSKNSKVAELQKLIGVAADGVFGSQTEAALVAKAGITSVSNQAELDKLKKTATNAINSSRGSELLTQFLTGKYSIMALVPSVYIQVVEDYAGALNPTGKGISFKAGKYVSKDDYKLVKVTKSGNVLMQVTKGDLQGLYSVDPSTISLVQA